MKVIKFAVGNNLLVWQIYQEIKHLFLYKKHLTKDKTISIKRLSKIGSLNQESFSILSKWSNFLA